MNKHTPGPWHIRYSEDRADAFIEYGDRSNITDTQSRLIAQCFMHSVEDNANATLMAASTDLIDALETIMPFVDCAFPQSKGSGERFEAVRKARAAIAKAKGVQS